MPGIGKSELLEPSPESWLAKDKLSKLFSGRIELESYVAGEVDAG